MLCMSKKQTKKTLKELCLQMTFCLRKKLQTQLGPYLESLKTCCSCVCFENSQRDNVRGAEDSHTLQRKKMTLCISAFAVFVF